SGLPRGAGRRPCPGDHRRARVQPGSGSVKRTAVILGMGGLGCPAALLLCEDAREAGVPLRLILVDDDRVEPSNLSRQILFRAADVGARKVEVASSRLARFAPLVEVVARPIRFDAATSATLLRGADVVL